MKTNSPIKGCAPMQLGNPKAAAGKVLQVPKLVRKDKAMPVKGKGK